MVKVVCDKLGVKIGQKWTGNDGNLYKFDGYGYLLKYNKKYDKWNRDNHALAKIIAGELEFSWSPIMGDTVYIADPTNGQKYFEHIWAREGGVEDMWKHFNLVYKTKDEAIKCAYQMLDAISEE